MCSLQHIHFPVGCCLMVELTVDDCIAIAARLEMLAGTIKQTNPQQSADEIIALIRKIRWAIAMEAAGL